MKNTAPLNKKGFSLVEVVIVSAVMLIVLTGVSMMMINMKKTQNRLESSQDLNNFNQLVNGTLKSQVTCTLALSGIEFNPSQKIQELKKVSLPNGLSIEGGKDLVNHSLRVNKVFLKNAVSEPMGRDIMGHRVHSTELYADLKTLRGVPGDGELGERLITPMFVTVKDGKIQSCGSMNTVVLSEDKPRDPASPEGPTPEETLCKSVSGTWDEDKKSCDSELMVNGCKALGGVWKGSHCEGMTFDFSKLKIPTD